MSQPAVHRFATGPTIMPPPRSYDAPYFSGRVSDPIEDFLDEYEELANSCGLTEHQKVETVTRYITASLRDFWKSLDSHQAHNWTDLRLTLEEIYDGPSAPTRSCHLEQKLRDFVRQSSKLCMNGEEDVLQYYRHFLTLGKPLCNSKRLSTNECNKLFWLGFHPHDRAELYARLIAKHPDQPSSICFDYLDVHKAARATFSENHLLDNSWDEPQGFRRNQPERTREQWLERDERELRDPRRADPKQGTYEHWHSSSPTDYIPHSSHYQRADTHHLPVPAPTPTASFCFQNPVLPPLSAPNLPSVPQSPFNPCVQVSENQLPLFNDLSIPNDGSGCGFKHGIDAWLAAQPQNAPVPMQRAPSAHEVPPHLPHSADSRAPSDRVEKVKEARTAQVIRAGKPREDSESDKEEPFLQVLAAEMKKCKARASKLPEFQARTPIAATAPTSSVPVATAVPTASAPTSPSAFIVPAAPLTTTPIPSATVLPPLSVPIVPAMPMASDSAALANSAASMSDVSAVAAPAVPVASALAVPSVSAFAVPAVAASASVTPAPTATSMPAQPTPQHRYQSSMEEQQLVSELQTWLIEGKLALTTPAHVLAASPTIRRELIGKPQAEATCFEEVASAQTLTITCRPAPPPQPPPQQQSRSKPLSITHPRSQQQHQSCHNHQFRLSHNKPESTSRITNPSQQAPDVAVARPPVLKDPDKVACREAKNPAGAQSGVTVTSPVRHERRSEREISRCRETVNRHERRRRSFFCLRLVVSHRSLFIKSSPPHFQTFQSLSSSSAATSSPPTPSAPLAVAPSSTPASATPAASDSHPADISASPTLDAPVTPTAAATTTATAAIAAVARARDPPTLQRVQCLWAQALWMCKAQIGFLLGLTGDGQDFDPPRGVRWAARLRS